MIKATVMYVGVGSGGVYEELDSFLVVSQKGRRQ